MPSRREVLAGLALSAACGAARADPPSAPRVLRAAWQDRLTTLDPYASSLRVALMLAHEVFDCLLDRDPDTFLLTPLLAKSWKQVDDLTLVFQLREGVTFHDGSPFEAEDVVATVRTVLSDPHLGIPSNYSWLAGAEARGAMAVALKLAHPFPAAFEFIAMVLPILPRSVTDPQRRESMMLAPVGTGPYRLERADADGTLHLSAFDPPGTKPPKGVPAIKWLEIRQDSAPSGPFQDLLEGRAEWMWQMTPAQIRQLATSDDLQVLRTDSMRVTYLAFDSTGRSEAALPFSRPELRRAACFAMDRTELAQETMAGAARPAIAPCAPTQFACDASVVVRYDHDPAKARALLAEAGYPEGLDTELVTYVRPEIAAAAAAQLAQGGIRARVTVLPAMQALARVQAGTAPIFLGTWGSSSINDISAFLPPFFEFGPLDTTRDTQTASLIASAGLAADPEQRRGLYRQAIRRITDMAYFLPLFVDPATYGVSRKLNFRPKADELPRFYQITWR